MLILLRIVEEGSLREHMITPSITINEDFRLQALKSLHILDTESEKEFDEITSLAAFLCDTEISLICLIDSDRNWYKSKFGLHINESPRAGSLCSLAISVPNEPLIIEDIRTDSRFDKKPFQIGNIEIVSYLGIPLVDKEGFALGTLCVMDSKPKYFSERQLDSLKSLANQVVILFELNRKNRDLELMQEELRKRNKSLKEFARVISHDLKMPLANVITTSDLLKLKLGDKLDEESNEYFGYIKESSFSMSDYINDILDHYESETLAQQQPETFYLNDLLKEIATLLTIQADTVINFPDPNPLINCNKSALKQVFFNLIGNSIKYNDKERIEISVVSCEDEKFYYFRLTDNGMGIAEDKLESIFELFTTANVADRSGHKGNGIGLSTVKKIIESLGGNITASSKLGEWTTLDFSIRK